MRCTWTGEGKASVIADEPDVAMRAYFKGKVLDALSQEWRDFLEEVNVAIRKCEPGQKLVIKSRPIEITVERPPKEDAPPELRPVQAS